jgi:hypothetical protein
MDKHGGVSIRNQRFPTTSQFVVITERILGETRGDAPAYA